MLSTSTSSVTLWPPRNQQHCMPFHRRFSIHRFIFALLLVSALASVSVYGQIAGEEPLPTDTSIVFTPVRPLMEELATNAVATQAAGFDLLFSGSGWGAGVFYTRALADNLSGFANIVITPRRNSDEVENVWYNGFIPIVANKINRLFMFPVSAGLQYRLFSDGLQETFRPYVSVGVTATPILQTPYLKDGYYYEFFESFGHGTWHMRMGGVIGLGSVFGQPGKGSVIGVNIRYYTIPYGEPGLESMAGLPITNFGAVFLSLSVGSAW